MFPASKRPEVSQGPRRIYSEMGLQGIPEIGNHASHSPTVRGLALKEYGLYTSLAVVGTTRSGHDEARWGQNEAIVGLT